MINFTKGFNKLQEEWSKPIAVETNPLKTPQGIMTVEKKFFTVSEITSHLKQMISNNFFSVRIQGEVSNFKIASSGHYYFSLKDEKAQMNAVLFKGKIPSNFSIKNGDLVAAEGAIEVYEPNGTYQLIIRTIQKAGIGDILAKIQALKEHYQRLGYFDPERKKELPLHPKKIAIVTALTGAVIQDIIKVLNCRVDAYHLLIAPVKVQGQGAPQEVAQALDLINLHQLADIIIIARGGGSFEDLLAFNDPIIIEAAFRSKIPIISAIGHETDFTLLDFVSDKRAATPSMAAEMVLPKTKDLILSIFSMAKRILDSHQSYLFRLKRNLTSQTKIFTSKQSLEALNSAQLKLSNTEENLMNMIADQMESKKQKLSMFIRLLKEKNPMQEQLRKKTALEKLEIALNQRFFGVLNQFKTNQDKASQLVYSPKLYTTILRKHEVLKSVQSHLEALNPKAILKKGYCIPFVHDTSQIIQNADQANQTNPFDLLFHDGKITVQPKHEVLNDTTKHL